MDKVELRIDPDNIFQLMVYTNDTSKASGIFIGCIKMLNIEELNSKIEQLNLNIKKIGPATNSLTWEELKDINRSENAIARATNHSTKAIRAKYRGKRYDLVEDKVLEAKTRKRKERQKREQKQLRQLAKVSISSQEEVLKTPDYQAPETDIKSQEFKKVQPVGESSEPVKIINFCPTIQQGSSQFFDDTLKAKDTDRPKLVVPHWKRQLR